MGFFVDLWQRYVLDVRAQTDREAAEWQATHGQGAADRRLAVVLTTVMLCMIFTRYLGSAGHVRNWIDGLSFVGLQDWAKALEHWVVGSENRRFNGRMFWALGRVLGYVVFPSLVILFILKDRIGDFGLRVKGILRHGKIYGLMLAGIAPLVVVVSFFESFQRKYPFYKLRADEAWWPYFICWELLYAMQFAALEFFFRGFMLHGTKCRLGYASVWVMMVPYMMIHFGKPMPECIGSIIAGFVLGTLSLKSNSVWWGVGIHVAVAWGMDLLSLWQRGLL
ncbi:MAG: CPBP family intramembrane glutamic endopeptidase [Myxococcota bacterium]